MNCECMHPIVQYRCLISHEGCKVRLSHDPYTPSKPYFAHLHGVLLVSSPDPFRRPSPLMLRMRKTCMQTRLGCCLQEVILIISYCIQSRYHVRNTMWVTPSQHENSVMIRTHGPRSSRRAAPVRCIVWRRRLPHSMSWRMNRPRTGIINSTRQQLNSRLKASVALLT